MIRVHACVRHDGGQEARCMVKVRKAGVETPCLYLVDSANTKIYMEKIDGVTAKHFFQSEHAGSGEIVILEIYY